MTNMIQPLAEPDQAQAPQDRDPSANLALADDAATTPVDDSGQGQILFVGFVTAVLFITSAVAFLALFTAWWVLGLVFGLDLLVTSVVGTAVFAILSNGKLGRKDETRAQLGLVTSLGSPAQSRTTSDHASPVAA